MSDIKKIKQARKLAYNVFEKTGNIFDYGKYKSLDEMVKQYEKENEFGGYGMQ